MLGTKPTTSAASGRRLQMQYAGGLVKHLGLSMYRGAVPAIAELISNSWDADAENVDVTVPLDTGLKDQEIRVADDGRGMTWDDVQNAYLLVGSDRRKREGRERTEKGRLIMGRKGLGKLAGFGIARVVEVRTVRDGSLTHFSMDFDQITRGGEAKVVEAYEPAVLEDRKTSERNGTVVTLKHFQISRPIPSDDFRESMSRRFSIFSKGISVRVNGEPLKPYAVPLQFKFKGGKDGWEEVDGVGAVKWWIGFTAKPIQRESARGVSILVREKMAQAPFFFDLSGGAYGQAGMQYMTGEVVADQLDTTQDFIGTDRQAIVWTEPMPGALLKWGEAKVRELLRDWAAARQTANEEKLTSTVNELNQTVEERISRLSPSEQKEARQVIHKLASIESVTDKPERARELLDLVLRAFEDSSFFALLKALGAADKAERDEVLKIVTELGVFETVRMAEVVSAPVGVIQAFREMIKKGVPEKPDMQDFLFKHPWLIDPEWIVVEHETRLESIIIKRFKLSRSAGPDSKKRVDFFCIGTRGRFLVVEVKRPGETIGQKEVVQIMNYVSVLEEEAPTSGQAQHRNDYEGVLVGHRLSAEGQRWRKKASKLQVVVRLWDELLDVAERIHREFLDAVIKQAPDDPRVQKVSTLDELGAEPKRAAPSRGRKKRLKYVRRKKAAQVGRRASRRSPKKK